MLKSITNPSLHLFSNFKFQLPACHHQPQQYTGPSYQEVLNNKLNYIPSAYAPYYKQPFLPVQGYMQYLWDHKGNRYLDLIGGICTISVGHSHPRVVQAIRQQADKLVHTSQIYLNQAQSQYSKQLCQQLGEGFDSIFLTNSGGEANDLAILLARLFTHNNIIVSLRNAYHGIVGGCRGITNVGTWNVDPMRSIQNEKLAWPNVYNGSIKDTNKLILDAQQALQANTTGKVAGMIFQNVQGVGGIVPMPDGYVPQIVESIKKRQGLIISDEVQTGFGRMGLKRWGFKWQGIKPDIVTMAKGIANGMPMGAVATRKEIANSFNKVYFNTYGGGRMQCKVAIEVLKIINENNLPQNCQNLQKYFFRELKRLEHKYEIIGNARGKGLMLGFEIVTDKKSKKPGKQEAIQLMELTKERGLLFGKGGINGNVLRIQPPMCITMQDAKYTIQALEDALISMK